MPAVHPVTQVVVHQVARVAVHQVASGENEGIEYGIIRFP
jgi:hypothetical protein